MPDLSGEGFVDEVELLDAVPASNAVAGTGADAPMVALGSSSGIAPIAPAPAPLPAPSPEPEIQPGKHWGWWPMAVVVLLAIAIMIFLAVHVPVISVGAG